MLVCEVEARKLLLLLFLTIFCGSSFAQVDWVKKSNNGAGANAKVKIDHSGRVYFTRNFTGEVLIGSRKIISLGKSDILLASYSEAGTLIWVKNFGGLGDDEVNDISIVPNGQNFFIIGSFSNSITFDKHNLSSRGDEDVFIAQFDKDGNCLWAGQAGGPLKDKGKSIRIDADGDISIGGIFQSKGDFFGQSLSTNSTSFFVAKIKSNKSAKWVKPIHATAFNAMSIAVGTDQKGNVYASGTFLGNLLLDGKNLIADTNFSALQNPGIFLIKFNSSGKSEWQNVAYAANSDSYLNLGEDILILNSNEVVLTGSLKGEIMFGNTTAKTGSGYGNMDVFIAKCSEQGKWVWVNVSTSPEYAWGENSGVSIEEKNEQIYLTGYYDNVLQFEGVLLTQEEELSSVFLALLNQDGRVLSIYDQITGDRLPGNVPGDITVGLSDDIFITAKSENQQTSSEVFIARLGAVTTHSLLRESSLDVSYLNTESIVFPNPTDGDFFVKLTNAGGKVKISLYDVNGKNAIVLFDEIRNFSSGDIISLSTSEISAGYYQVELSIDENKSYSKLSIIP